MPQPFSSLCWGELYNQCHVFKFCNIFDSFHRHANWMDEETKFDLVHFITNAKPAKRPNEQSLKHLFSRYGIFGLHAMKLYFQTKLLRPMP